MYIGGLRRKITFQQQDETVDGKGSVVPNWTDYYTCRAAIEPLQGRELMAAMQIQANISHRVSIRWPGASIMLSPKMRIVRGARYFDVQAVLDLNESQREMQILCLERVGED